MQTQEIRICQSNACRKAGAIKVLTAFQFYAPTGVTVDGVTCLGQCGNGPMVLMLPEQVWYGQVHPDEVDALIKHHVLQGVRIKAMLYKRFHPDF